MTPKEASDLIEAAIVQAMQSNGEEGDLLLDWIVVGYAANADPEKGNGYPMFFSDGHVPSYRARGLLVTGMGMLSEPDDD